jgi:hypothetical protein
MPKKRSLSTWCFAVGMLVFGLENLFGAIWREAVIPEKAAFWGSLTLIAKSFFPGIWICFSLTYSRANARTLPKQSRLLVLVALLVPVGISLIFRNQLMPVSPYAEPGVAATILNGFQVVAAVVILMHLERTFRSAVGTMQWRIKFIVIGLGIIFGARIYTASQALLFSESILVLSSVDTAALLIGCALIVVAFLRSVNEIEVYPRMLLRTLTVVTDSVFFSSSAYLLRLWRELERLTRSSSRHWWCCWLLRDWLSPCCRIDSGKRCVLLSVVTSKGRSTIFGRSGPGSHNPCPTRLGSRRRARQRPN